MPKFYPSRLLAAVLAGILSCSVLAQASTLQADLLLRSYIEDKRVEAEPVRQPWIQSVQLNLSQPWQISDELQLSAQTSLFGALTLHDPANIGELAHQGRGREVHDLAYPGRYGLRLQASDWGVHWGLQDISLPFMVAKDNLWLPPTWHGITGYRQLNDELRVEGGQLSRARLRGREQLDPLLSAYAYTPFDHLRYAGLAWQYQPQGKLQLYVNQATDLWRQLYLTADQAVTDDAGRTWQIGSAFYTTTADGRARQGAQDGEAASLTAGLNWHGVSLSVSVQRIWSDHVLDYLLDAYGPGLAIVMVSDYNAPQEFAQQIKLDIADSVLGVTDLQLSLWALAGQSAAPALRNRQGEDRRHHEIGFGLLYRFRDGMFSGGDLMLTAINHRANGPYPDPTQRAMRLVLNWPVKLF